MSWATVFHGRLAITKKPLNFEQSGALNNAVSLYRRENASGVQKRPRFQGFERYLSTHRVDPENSFVGVYVSEDFRDLPVAESNAGVTAGAMVLARVERGGDCVRAVLGDSVLCRVCREPAKPGDDDCPVLVSFDPEERHAEEVPLGVLTVLTHVHEAALVAAQSGDFGALADPAENIYRQFRDETLAPNIVTVAMGGLEEVLAPEKTEALLRGASAGVWDIKSLEYVARFFKMEITDKEIMDNYARGLSAAWDEHRAGLLAAAAAHAVSFNVLVEDANLAALRGLTLCGMVRRAVAERAAAVEKVVAETKAARDAILAGESKQTMMNEYLAATKKGVNGFLAARGYDFALIPPNYTEAPPADRERVVENLRVCRAAARDPELRQIIKIVCDAAYIKIDAWVSGAAAILAKKFEVKADASTDVRSILAAVRPGLDALLKEKPDSKTTKRYAAVLEDVEYFLSMKKADEELNAKSEERGIPVLSSEDNGSGSGGGMMPGEYIMSIHAAARNRLKMTEEECLTVVDIWGSEDQKRRARDVGTEREVRLIPEAELVVVKNVPENPDAVVDMTLPQAAGRILSMEAPKL